MSILGQVRTAVRQLRPPQVDVIRTSLMTERVAEVLRRRAALRPETRSRVEELTRRLEAEAAARPEAAVDGMGESWRAALPGLEELALLQNLVAWAEAGSILEVGAGYGLNAIAMGHGQRTPALVAVDADGAQGAAARDNVLSTFEAGAEVILEDKGEVLPRLVTEGRSFDFVLHGGDDGDTQVADFQTLLPAVEPGGLYLVDDIRRDNRPEARRHTEHSTLYCYEGWLQVANDPAVCGAIEVNKRLGVLVLA